MRIELNSAVNLTFSLKYLVNFAKSSSLSGVVQLMMSNEVPLLVSSSDLARIGVGAGADRTCMCRSRTSSARATFGTTSRPRSATTERG